MSKKAKSGFSQKWPQRVAAYGYYQLPLALLNFRKELQLTPNELLVFLYIAVHHWGTGRDPYPSLAVIAQRSGFSQSTIRNHVRALVRKGYIVRRLNNGFSSSYSIRPLGAALDEILRSMPKHKYFQPGAYRDLDRPPYQDPDTKVDKGNVYEDKLKPIILGAEKPADYPDYMRRKGDETLSEHKTRVDAYRAEQRTTLSNEEDTLR